MFGKKEEPNLTLMQKVKLFVAVHWRGCVCVVTPLILCPMVTSNEKKMWTAFTLVLMAIYWVTECIPLAVTGFMPCFIFPFVGVGETNKVCSNYVNDSIMMFLGSIMLAYSVEQSGFHKRLAYACIRLIGYSHLKLLLAMCVVTTFASMWITNTAATTMMVPINFALLKVFENEGVLSIYEQTKTGETVASDITACYFCAATFSATIGGIGTLVGTGTNLVFKGLFISANPNAPDLLSFPMFSAFATPYMIVLSVLNYLYLSYMYFGLFRANSAIAKTSAISEKGQAAAKKTIDTDWKKLGNIKYWEWMVIFLFGGAIIAFFCRSPQIFPGWGDVIENVFNKKKQVADSALAMFVIFFMMLLPASLTICKNFTAKFHEDLPKGRIRSVLDWKSMNATLPYSFMFLLGGGFALSSAAKSSGLNEAIGDLLSGLRVLPNLLIIMFIILITVFVTNFASNVAVCNVFAPISMTLAKKTDNNALWYCLAAGFSASFCFMIPVGTPGNLIVQSAAKVPTSKMIKAGFGPTMATIIVTWAAISFYAPIVWPDLRSPKPEWENSTSP